MHELVGRWRLVSWSSKDGDGVISYPMGDGPGGSLVYTSDGWMAAQMSGADRPPLGAGPPDPSRLAAAFMSYVAYCGPYEIQGDRVVHRPDVSLIPDFVGTELVRLWSVTGDTLVLRTPPFELGGHMQESEVTWARVGAAG